MVKFPKIKSTPAMQHLAGAWEKLTRLLQARTEHMRVTNSEGTALVDGELLYFDTGDRQAKRTTAATSAQAEVACVSCEPTAAGGRGVARNQGLAWVLFEPGLTTPAPASGQPAFTSATAGRARNFTPPVGWSKKIGVIEDASTYDTLGGCYVNFNHCCTPTQVPD